MKKPTNLRITEIANGSQATSEVSIQQSTRGMLIQWDRVSTTPDITLENIAVSYTVYVNKVHTEVSDLAGSDFIISAGGALRATVQNLRAGDQNYFIYVRAEKKEFVSPDWFLRSVVYSEEAAFQFSQSRKDSVPQLGNSFTYPFKLSGSKFTLSSNEKSISECIKSIMGSSMGETILNPTYGVLIDNLVFKNNPDLTLLETFLPIKF